LTDFQGLSKTALRFALAAPEQFQANRRWQGLESMKTIKLIWEMFVILDWQLQKGTFGRYKVDAVNFLHV
jgi:hypothetical protein